MFKLNTIRQQIRRPYSAAFATMALLGLTQLAQAGGGTITLSPANNIQAAVNSGQYSEIVLNPGQYNQTIVIDSADAPLTLRSTDPSDSATVAATKLDGQFLGTSIVLLNAGVGADVVIDGLTFINGEATGTIGSENRGGAVDCEGASPTIRRCVFHDNQASGFGGAIYANAATMTIEDCEFKTNSAPNGGAVYLNASAVQINSCLFQSNSAASEGGACRVYNGTFSFDQCDFESNFAGVYGGAIATRQNALFSATRCYFHSNSCGDGGPNNGRGGAIEHDGSDSSFLENCIFFNNACARYGGSIYSFQTITLRNTTHILDNCGAQAGAVVAMGSAGVLNMYNCIAWGFGGTTPLGATGAHNVTYCDIQGGYTGAGNINVDPQFADANGDFHLTDGSPCIDAGDATKVLGQYPLDYDSAPRVLNDPDTPDTGIAQVGVSVDMGAFEFQPESVIVSCPADITDASGTGRDGLVNVFDLLDLLSAWGACD